MQGNSWIGPAAVLYKLGQSVWLHTNGDIKKVAACKVKPYKLVDREAIQESGKEVSKPVMLEDGLESVENLMDKKDDPTEAELDTVGAKYLKVVNSVIVCPSQIWPSILWNFLYPNTGGLKSRRPRILKSIIYLTMIYSRRLKM